MSKMIITAAQMGIVTIQPKNDQSIHDTSSSAHTASGMPMNIVRVTRSDLSSDQSFTRSRQVSTARTGKKTAPAAITQSFHVANVRFPNTRTLISSAENPSASKNQVHFALRLALSVTTSGASTIFCSGSTVPLIVTFVGLRLRSEQELSQNRNKDRFDPYLLPFPNVEERGAT